jgi:hypothetical protein
MALQNVRTATPAALGTNVVQSSHERLLGRANCRLPPGMGPTSATPKAPRLNARTAPMPRAMPARGTGTRGTVRLRAKKIMRRTNENFHLKAEDLAELTSDNREARAVEEAVENRPWEKVCDKASAANLRIRKRRRIVS